LVQSGAITDISPADLSLTSANGQTLAAAAATATIHVDTWTQTIKSILWSETHKGKFYWDGHQVWVKSYVGYAGYHNCNNGYAAGGVLTNLICTAPAGPATGLDIKDKFLATGIAKGLPFSSTHWMNVHPNGNGTIPVTHSS
jgi:hypothetical protein